MSAIRVFALACCAALALLAALPASASERVRYSTGQFVVNCAQDATLEKCEAPEILKVRVRHGGVDVEKVRYRASANHCSPVRVSIKLDGERVGRTEFLGPNERAVVEHLHERLDQGRHKFSFRGKGKVGGCNVGTLLSWGGKIKVIGHRR